MRTTRPHRVVVVGGGFGGLLATRFLARSKDVEITLLDRRNHHLFQPLLDQVATGILSPGQISPVLRHMLRKRTNVRVILSEVHAFDLERRIVHTRVVPGRFDEFPYDSLIVAAGAGQSYFGHDEFALIAPGMKTIDDAMELRRRVYGALELAETMDDDALERFWMTFVIVGAGATGVELAGQIRELAARSLSRDFRSIDPTKVRVVVVDGGEEPLANFGGSLAGRARRTLEKMGVELQMGQRVVGVDPFGVDIENAAGEKGRVEAATTIWAAGVQASPLAAALAEASGATTDKAGRIEVLPDLTLPGHPEVFALGDMASINNLPGVCEVAMQGGLHAANTIKRRLKGKEGAAFKYRDLGSAAAIGRFKSIVNFKGIKLSGFAGWTVWFFVHIGFLNGFTNRASTMVRWFRSMVGRARPERVFSVGHTGGDLSLPEDVRRKIMPHSFPVQADAPGWAARVAKAEGSASP
ncbi:MAG TPA: NAD(P)/FAD-dependent oxidoreductase [Acidimicrobiales bacterium]|nr:NAD(P)/FAD-dependent oxidoreductase [Acidimicrobiales bacterium]